MLTPVSLTFEGAGSYRQAGPIMLEDQGVVFVRGENIDGSTNASSVVTSSNGAGKSTPWGVLNHILYGVTDKGLKKAAIMTLLPDSDGYFGEFVFKKDGKTYMVRQARAHSKFGTGVFVFERSEDDSKWINITPKLSKDAQDFVSDQLIGLSLHEWHGCVFLSHGMAHILIEGTGSERRNYLSALFQLDRYDALNFAVSEELKLVDVQLAGLSSLEDKVSDIRNRMSELLALDVLVLKHSILLDADALATAKITKAKTDIEDCKLALQDQETRSALVSKLTELGYSESDRDETLAKRATAKSRQSELTAERDSVTLSIGQLEQRQSLIDEIKSIPPEVKMLESFDLDADTKEYQREQSKLISLKQQLLDRADLKAKLNEFESYADYDGITKAQSDLKEELATVAGNIRNVKLDKDALTSITGKSSCPTCKSDLNPKIIASLLSALEEKEDTLKTKRTELNASLVKIDEKVEKATEYLATKKQLSKIPDDDIDKVNARLQELKQNISENFENAKLLATYLSLKRRLDGLPNVDSDIPTLEKQLRMINKQLEKAEEEYSKYKVVMSLMQQLDDLPYQSPIKLNKKLSIAEETYMELLASSKAVASELSLMSSQITMLEEFQSKLEETTEGLVALPELRARHRRLTALKKAFPALKIKHLHNITLAIKEILPRYVSMMFTEQGISFTVDESDDSIEIYARRSPVNENGDATNVDLPVRALSNGEKKRLSIAFLFTLHDLLSPSKLIDLLILDEVDGGLDDDGLESLMSLIEDKKAKYGTIIMISHRQAIAAARFDKVWVARKKDHESKLITANPESEAT